MVRGGPLAGRLANGRTMRFALVVLIALTFLAPAAHADPTPADSSAAPDARELERRLDLLAREIDDLRLGEVAGPPESRHGLGPAASKVYAVGHGLSLGGYGEMLYADFAAERQNGSASNARRQIDFVRQILYVGYKFDSRFIFNSEIEFEHASTSQAGSVAVEFATVDAMLRRDINLRGGLLLVPMGLINELHEPPVFLGARRPEIERRILPSTWRANGIGIFGDTEVGLSYRAYLIESLRADRFDGSGLRGGRQHGSEALFESVAGTARLDYTRAGVRAGASLFHGNTSQGLKTTAGRAFDGRTTIYEGHVDAHTRGARFRVLVACANVADADAINELRNLMGDGGGASVGSELFGYYVEAGYDLWSRLRPEARLELVPFVRYEELDTQSEVPSGYVKSAANADRITTAGAAFYPHPQVVVKADYQWHRDDARTGTNQWNAALGYLF